MINDAKILAIIPARKGSVGLKNKNIKSLRGSPLISWTIKQSKYSKYIDKIVVSTDCKKTINVAKDMGIDVPYKRPKYLSSSTASSFAVVEHMIRFLKNNNNEKYDYIVLLEPTSPLREKNDIDKMIYQLNKNKKNYDSIVSIGELKEHPSLIKKTKKKSLIPYNKKIPINIRRQLFDTLFFPYGGIYIIKERSLLKEKTFYPKKQTSFLIKRYQKYGIDDLYDFLSVENIMKHKKFRLQNYERS